MGQLVTIVIPTYNDDPDHLAQAIASAQAQTWPDVEVVVIDDGSDVPVQLDGVRVIRQDNAGPAAAMNTGVAASSGELILVLGGDDRINAEFVAACLAVMTPGVAFAYSQIDFFWEDGRIVPQPPPHAELGLRDFLDRNRAAATALFRRSDFDLVGGFTAQPRTVLEDYDLWVRLLRQEDDLRAVHAHGAVLSYRQREGSRRSSWPYVQRLAVTRARLLETDDPVVLRRMVAAAWAGADEMRETLVAARAEAEGGPVKQALRKVWRAAVPVVVRNRL